MQFFVTVPRFMCCMLCMEHVFCYLHTHALPGTTQAQATCYTSTGCAGTSFTATSPRDCCVSIGSSYNNVPGTTCSSCTGEWRVVCRDECSHTIHAVWGFQDSSGDTITELLVSELGLSVAFRVTFTVIKGNRPGFRQVDITSTPITASATTGSRSDQPT